MMVIFFLRNCCSTLYLGSRPNTQPQYTKDKSDDAAGNIRSQISCKFLTSCKLIGTFGFNDTILFPACRVWIHGRELCLLLHLHEDEVAWLHAILKLATTFLFIVCDLPKISQLGHNVCLK